jgi:hypothetical protein
MGALPPNPAEGFVRVDSSTLSQFLEIASAISDGGFAPNPAEGFVRVDSSTLSQRLSLNRDREVEA